MKHEYVIFAFIVIMNQNINYIQISVWDWQVYKTEQSIIYVYWCDVFAFYTVKETRVIIRPIDVISFAIR